MGQTRVRVECWWEREKRDRRMAGRGHFVVQSGRVLCGTVCARLSPWGGVHRVGVNGGERENWWALAEESGDRTYAAGDAG